MATVQFYFDYVSPYSYLAQTQFAGLGLDVDYRPITAIDVMAVVNNQPSPKCPAKLNYALRDTTRWAERYGVPLALNLDWWRAFESGALTMRPFARGALAALQLGYFPGYHKAIFEAIWAQPRDVGSERGRHSLLEDARLPAAEIWRLAETPEFDALLDEANKAAAEAGVFGVPIFVVGQEMFFGNDRLDFVKEYAA